MHLYKNLPNYLTVLRLLLVPVFVCGMMYYSQSVSAGHPVESYRWGSVTAFIIASFTDFLDGWIARHFHLTTPFGALLDPLADKLLILSALVIFTFVPTPGVGELPLWFMLMILLRDGLIVVGAVIAWRWHRGKVRIDPHWMGKIATCLLMVLLSVLLLKIKIVPLYLLVDASAFFVLLSTIYYFVRGFSALLKPEDAPRG